MLSFRHRPISQKNKPDVRPKTAPPIPPTRPMTKPAQTQCHRVVALAVPANQLLCLLSISVDRRHRCSPAEGSAGGHIPFGDDADAPSGALSSKPWDFWLVNPDRAQVSS